MDKRLPGAVLLRDVTEDDLPIFYEHQLDAEANRMAAFPARDMAAFMAHWDRILGDDSIIKKTILLNGHVVGNIVSFERFGERHVGYWTGRAYWGKGITTIALSEFLGQVKARPLYARVAKHNVASRRVLKKCGFTLFGEDTYPSNAYGEQVEEFILILRENERHEA